MFINPRNDYFPVVVSGDVDNMLHVREGRWRAGGHHRRHGPPLFHVLQDIGGSGYLHCGARHPGSHVTRGCFQGKDLSYSFFTSSTLQDLSHPF